MKLGPADDDSGLTRAHIHRECNRSLERLATDYIDLYYMHTTDNDTPIAESIAASAELIHGGKVKYWGLSNYDPDQVRQVLKTCDDGGWPRPVAHQPPYSLLKPGIEQELLPLCRKEGIAVVPCQVLQGGLLTGKYCDSGSPPEGSRGAKKPEWLLLLDDDRAMTELEQAIHSLG